MLARRGIVFGITVVTLSFLLYLILRNVTNSINDSIVKPYMDEIFHVPQAQQFCQGKFDEYDPKLTTPPGLYIISCAILWVRDKLFMRRNGVVCETTDLRQTNHLMAALSFITVTMIQLVRLQNAPGRARQNGLKCIDHLDDSDLTRIILNSIAIFTLPPLFFFYSLYYTDIGSLLFILLGYFFSFADKHLLASTCGLISIMFRQTNIVWVFYIACLTILRTCEQHDQRMAYSKESVPRSKWEGDRSAKAVMQQSEKKVNEVTGTNSASELDSPAIPDCCKGHSDEHNSRRALRFGCWFSCNQDLALELSKRCLPYALVGAMFLAFVFVNGGIALGDKEAHQPRCHLAQILYFLGFCAVFGHSWIFNIRILRRFLYFTIRSPLAIFVATLFIISIIFFGRYAHPYLLADNRHITFYLWRRILDRHNSYAPYMLTSIYLMASFSIWHHFRLHGGRRLLLYILCTAAVTVPNGLLELRYFIIPYIFLRLKAEIARRFKESCGDCYCNKLLLDSN